MGSMRGPGMGAGAMRAERSPHGRGARAGQADLPKRKPNLKKLWPQIRAMIAPRLGLLIIGLVLMGINRVAGLAMPYYSKPLLDHALNPAHPQPAYLAHIIEI